MHSSRRGTIRMATPENDPNRATLPRTDAATKCLPVGGRPGDMATWDGFNWILIPRPDITDPAPYLRFGANGPYWSAN